jgi:hypothetical protein
MPAREQRGEHHSYKEHILVGGRDKEKEKEKEKESTATDHRNVVHTYIGRPGSSRTFINRVSYTQASFIIQNHHPKFIFKSK